MSCALLATVGLAQDDAADRRAAVALAVESWIDEYEHDRLSPRGVLHKEAGLEPAYARIARGADLLFESASGSLTHLDALQKLLVHAEHDPDEAVARALLGVAGAGLDRSLFDRDAMVLRDAGHWSLMRMDDQRVHYVLMRTAAGNRLPLLVEGAEAPPLDPALRVAALKVLGMQKLPMFRGVVEGCLADFDPRVRLASVEALDFQRRPESLPVLVRMLGVERHPVVSQAIVRAVGVLMTARGRDLAGDERERAVGTLLRAFGECGWRTDMDLLDIVERFPHRDAVPVMIDLLDRPRHRGDELVELVNKNASPHLRSRAYDCLRGLTGSILPIDDVAAWRAFWQRERDHVRVPDVLPRQRAGSGTASSFFGIPVTGQEIAFLIDTSGSMNEAVGGTATPGGRRSNNASTRLSLAKEQLLLAVSAMDPASRYHLLTFDDEAQLWSRKAVPPTKESTRALTELLSRLQPEGGTNVYDGLVQALELDELHFGQEGKKAIDELFLLSDGEPTAGPVRDADEILALVQGANKYLKVRINTVYTGAGRGADFLRKLAEQNDGVFVQR